MGEGYLGGLFRRRLLGTTHVEQEVDRLLALVGQKRKVVPGDGNCQYRAILSSALVEKANVGQSILELCVKTYQQLVSGAEFYEASRCLGMWAF